MLLLELLQIEPPPPQPVFKLLAVFVDVFAAESCVEEDDDDDDDSVMSTWCVDDDGATLVEAGPH